MAEPTEKRRRSKYSKYEKGDVFFGFEVMSNPVVHKTHYSAYFMCTCGSTFFRTFSNLKRKGNVGCIECSREHQKESSRIHNVEDKKLYQIWKAMNYRCKNKRGNNYHHYGGRGIQVCDRWCCDLNPVEGLVNFNKDMGERPSPRHSLDRIDVDGNYEPSNCRWATQTTQTNNTRRNHFVTLDGDNYTISELARSRGIKPNTLLYRLRRGWSIEEAVEGRRYGKK